MGFLGKILVLVHGAVSIALLTWAIGVYAERIKWTSADKSNPGVFDQQQARATELNTAIDRSYTRWSGNLLTVQNLENERFARRSFYPTQLVLLREGQLGGMAVPNPVQQLVVAPNGFLDIRNQTGRMPIMSGTVALKSIRQYLADMDAQYMAFDQSQKQSLKYLEDREVLNKKIVGTDGPPAIKGLRTYLTEQLNMEDAALAQERYDTTYLVNLEAEFGLLKKRRDALNARMNELAGK